MLQSLRYREKRYLFSLRCLEQNGTYRACSLTIET